MVDATGRGDGPVIEIPGEANDSRVLHSESTCHNVAHSSSACRQLCHNVAHSSDACRQLHTAFAIALSPK
jgi:hypothetical protein